MLCVGAQDYNGSVEHASFHGFLLAAISSERFFPTLRARDLWARAAARLTAVFLLQRVVECNLVPIAVAKVLRSERGYPLIPDFVGFQLAADLPVHEEPTSVFRFEDIEDA